MAGLLPTIRYRRSITRQMEVQVGATPFWSVCCRFVSPVYGEVLVGQAMTRHFGVKYGLRLGPGIQGFVLATFAMN